MGIFNMEGFEADDLQNQPDFSVENSIDSGSRKKTASLVHTLTKSIFHEENMFTQKKCTRPPFFQTKKETSSQTRKIQPLPLSTYSSQRTFSGSAAKTQKFYQTFVTKKSHPSPLVMYGGVQKNKQRSDLLKNFLALAEVSSKKDPTSLHSKTSIHEKERDQEKQQQQHDSDEIDEISEIEDQKKKKEMILPLNLSRPKLPPPGLFAIYWIIEKNRLQEAQSEAYIIKEELDAATKDADLKHKQWFEELKKAANQEKAKNRWSMAIKIFSWFTSFTVILAGAVMLSTGSVGGLLLIAGGVLTLTSHIMETTGAWDKISKSLPTDDPQKKKAIVMWMQIALTLISLIIAGAGIIFGGINGFKDSLSIAQSMVNAAVHIGEGTCMIGQGITEGSYCSSLGSLSEKKAYLTRAKHSRKVYFESFETSIKIVEDIFDSIDEYLKVLRDLFAAEQRIIRRG